MCKVDRQDDGDERSVNIPISMMVFGISWVQTREDLGSSQRS